MTLPVTVLLGPVTTARERGPDSAPEDSVVTVAASDVDEVFARAQRMGYEVVHPPTDEPWGIRRFLVRDPHGNVINVVRHRD